MHISTVTICTGIQAQCGFATIGSVPVDLPSHVLRHSAGSPLQEIYHQVANKHASVCSQCLYVYLSIEYLFFFNADVLFCLSLVYHSIYLSIFLSIYLNLYLSIYLSKFISINLCACILYHLYVILHIISICVHHFLHVVV